MAVGPPVLCIAADDHRVIPHVHVDGISTLGLQNRLSTTAQYCFHDTSLKQNLIAIFVYPITPYIELYFNSHGVRYIRALLYSVELHSPFCIVFMRNTVLDISCQLWNLLQH